MSAVVTQKLSLLLDNHAANIRPTAADNKYILKHTYACMFDILLA